MKFRVFAALLLVVGAGGMDQASAQGIAQRSPFQSQSVRDRFREQFNENALFLMGGPLGQSDIGYASDIATVVDDGHKLRVLPVVGAAAVQNVKDVLFLRGVDLALTDTATLNALQRSKETGPDLEKQIAYVSVLYAQEVHVVARGDINSLDDLRGKKVNFDVPGSGSAMHLPGFFESLGVQVERLQMPQTDAIERMRQGTLDATVCICAKPVSAFASIEANWGFKLIGFPYVAPFHGDLLPASITSDDYPGLLAGGAFAETVATTAVLITFNWPRGSHRYERTQKFVEAFFSKFPEFLKAPRQPGWQTVNLAATMPGWQQFPPGREWLEKNNRTQASTVQAEFAKFAAERGGEANAPMEDNPLFREFLEWKTKQAN